ncbi:EAL domain-containing protein [Sphingomonas sp. LHG3406-1]|uniref:putative bifunctional diguanylate cyclase/phosphodiesterase n=1 Tax=Sphingomonas sp. LHG3406-1 TaxID=2804617 RepID=UPI0026140DBD|nr:EAL domain-containing protein [Sphingomonas sp. LHG3406-1]
MLGTSPALFSRPARTATRRAEWVMVFFLLGAVAAFIWNGSALLRLLASQRVSGLDPSVQVAAAALVLNVALILFGWRRYADLQQEAALRADGEQRAARQAATDSITGLANRKGFAEGVEQLCERALDAGHCLVIISLQMQRFKRINDRFGYDMGDALLREIAAAMQADVPADAVVARLSGDEFAIAACIRTADLATAETLAETLLRDVSRTYDLQGSYVQVGAIAGIASGSPGVPCRAADLLRRADIALDHARSARAARPTWFDGGMELALIERSELEQAIRVGLDHGQFIPYFEPQVDLVTGRLTGFEVLARWQHPNRGVLGAELFIPVAEEMGLMGPLCEAIVTQALDSARAWDQSLSLSVNISPTQLSDLWLAQRLVRLLTEQGFPPERLIVEITESSLFADLDLARNLVVSLKNQGIRIALDDFGTGYSSLSHLRMLPLDMIKIDKSFIATLHVDRESAAIVKAVATLAQALDVPVTAEGLEDAATYEKAVSLGASTGQGWYLGKPMAADSVADLLARRRTESAPEARRVG